MLFRQYNDKILTWFAAIFLFFLKFYAFSFPIAVYQPSGLSRLPVCTKDHEDSKGILYTSEYLLNLTAPHPRSLDRLLHDADLVTEYLNWWRNHLRCRAARSFPPCGKNCKPQNRIRSGEKAAGYEESSERKRGVKPGFGQKEAFQRDEWLKCFLFHVIFIFL